MGKCKIIFRVPLLSDEINRGVKDTTNKSGAFGTLHVIYKIESNQTCLQADGFDYSQFLKIIKISVNILTTKLIGAKIKSNFFI